MFLKQHGRTDHVCCHYGNTELQKGLQTSLQMLEVKTPNFNYGLEFSELETGNPHKGFFQGICRQTGFLDLGTWQRPTSKPLTSHPLTPSFKPQGSQDHFAVKLCLSMLTLGCRSHVKQSGPSTSDCRQNRKNFPSLWHDRSASSPHVKQFISANNKSWSQLKNGCSAGMNERSPHIHRSQASRQASTQSRGSSPCPVELELEKQTLRATVNRISWVKTPLKIMFSLTCSMAWLHIQPWNFQLLHTRKLHDGARENIFLSTRPNLGLDTWSHIQIPMAWVFLCKKKKVVTVGAQAIGEHSTASSSLQEALFWWGQHWR